MPEHMIEKQKDLELFIKSMENGGDENAPDLDGQLIRSRLSAIISSPLIEQRQLEFEDIRVIAILLNGFLKGHDGMKSLELLNSLDKSGTPMLQWITKLLRLKKLGVIEVEERRSETDDGIAGLLRSELRLSNDFINSIFSDIDSEQTSVNNVEPYKDNYEYLSDQFERVRILEDIAETNYRRYGHRRQKDEYREMEEELGNLESRITMRLKAATEKFPLNGPFIAARYPHGVMKVKGKVFPFERLKAYKKLSKNEEIILLALLRSEHNKPGEVFDIERLISDISRNQYEKFINMNICQKDGQLEKKGLVEIFSNKFGIDSIGLKENVRLMLLDKKKQTKSGIKYDNFFEFIKPSVTLNEVILPPETAGKLNLITATINGEAYRRLKEWNIKGYNLTNRSANKKVLGGINILFHGDPGTGKTLAAQAIARELGSNILTLDCSRILDKWVGNSEKNTRAIFDRYAEISKGAKKRPVLLLNEVDQFLHVRLTENSRSVDISFNQMQNIFLEQMEKFEGILIATTNLVKNLDSAFSRRFHYKIQFKRPDAPERLKLWHLHLPEKAPLAKDVNIELLAENYRFSGGQIAVAVQNATMKAAIRGDRICQEDFVTACEDEMKGNFDEKAIRAVGF